MPFARSQRIDCHAVPGRRAEAMTASGVFESIGFTSLWRIRGRSDGIGALVGEPGGCSGTCASRGPVAAGPGWAWAFGLLQVFDLFPSADEILFGLKKRFVPGFSVAYWIFGA